ncbi:MAG: sensor histidine kinase [Limnobacter sp.]|nr:sensor histidine kinase [Limnobacter sp.]
MATLILAFIWLFFQTIKNDTPHSAEARAIAQVRHHFMPNYLNAPPPADLPGWRPLTLPHRADNMGHSQGGYYWYVFEVDVPPNSRIDSIYLPRVAANAEVFVNGQLAGLTGPLEGKGTARNWNRPIAILGMPELRKPGTHTVAIQVRIYENFLSGISTIWVGPSQDIRAAWVSRMFNQIGLLIASIALMIGAAVVLLILSLLPPTRRPYLVWLILACVFWVVRSSSFMINDPPLGYENWVRLAQLCLIAFFMVVFYLTIRFCEYPKRHLEKKVLILFLVGTPMLVIAPSTQLFTLVGWFGGVGMIACLWGAGLLIKKGNQLQDLTIHGFAWGMVSLFLLSLNDLLMLAGTLSFNWYFLNQYLGFMLFLALAYFMAYEYARMLREARHFNTNLQIKLSEQALHLQAKHETLQQTEMQKVKLAERQRLMADMHDGLGAHLVSAIHQLRNDAIPRQVILEMLQDGLRDLQLTIDSLEPIENDLSVLVGAFRYRVSPSLNACNIILNWRVAPAIPPLRQLNPQMGLMILRILQEVFTNILKHSKASEVTFQLRQIDQNVELVITDNGIGFDVESTEDGKGEGKGIGNMKHRAHQIGATLEFTSGPNQGTRLRLTLPVEG